MSRREAAERFEVSVAFGGKVAAALVISRGAPPREAARRGGFRRWKSFQAEILILIAQRPDPTGRNGLQNCASDGSKPAAARSGVFSKCAADAPAKIYLRAVCYTPTGFVLTHQQRSA